MRLTSIETTPNPNSMKLNLDQTLGKSATYMPTQRQGCPEIVEKLLDIGGMQSVFVCHDFITLNRDPRVPWQSILEKATGLFGGTDSLSVSIEEQRRSAEKEGQVSVFVQTFRGIPVQVKVVGAEVEKRISTGQRFSDAAQLIRDKTGADYLKERYWADWGVRYGSAEEIAAEIADEIEGTINDKVLNRLVAGALGEADAGTVSESPQSLRDQLKAPDWHTRLRVVQEIGTIEDTVPLLTIALQDSHTQVRRLAAAALGATGSTKAIAPLCDALLSDQAVAVRRTAGDALSDLGDVSAQSAVCRALSDTNKLVRWRAARFLAEVGNEEALPYLVASAADPEFEVRLEIEAATQRIKGGLEGTAPAWKRILEAPNTASDKPPFGSERKS
jgi:hypothetical protein